MSCGDTNWWREPDLVGLLQRHGQAEHLVVQCDFATQVWRDPRMEYSIPGASKSRTGSSGFADIVSVETREIWEIKPRHLEDQASREADWYVKWAKVGCHPAWVPGTTFTTSNLYGGGGVVYRLEGNGNKAELIARQGRPGTVLYFWRINGQELPSLVPYFAWCIRDQIVKDYFPDGLQPQALPGSKPGDNFPPVKFKPPVPSPDACIPVFIPFLVGLYKQIRTTCAQTMVENSSVAILVQASIVDALVGPLKVAEQIKNMQLPPQDPTITLYREALAVLLGASVAHGVVGLAVGIAYALPLIIAGAVQVGSVLVLTCETALAGGTAATVPSGGLLGSLAAGIRAVLSLRTAVATGASFVIFAIPRASYADSKKPDGFEVSMARFVVLKPSESNVRVGQSKIIDGVEWKIAGIAKTLPG